MKFQIKIEISLLFYKTTDSLYIHNIPNLYVLIQVCVRNFFFGKVEAQVSLVSQKSELVIKGCPQGIIYIWKNWQQISVYL